MAYLNCAFTNDLDPPSRYFIDVARFIHVLFVCLCVTTLACRVHCVNLAIWLLYDNKLTYLRRLRRSGYRKAQGSKRRRPSRCVSGVVYIRAAVPPRLDEIEGNTAPRQTSPVCVVWAAIVTASVAVHVELVV